MPISKKQRLADVRKIRSIDWARSGIDGTGSMSPRARRTLAVYIVLVKMEYSGVNAPMGAIADAVWRSSHGEAGSIRTLQRANRELEERGFLKIRRSVHSAACIIFNLDAFSYWTQNRSSKVLPLPTNSHNVVSRETMCDNMPHTTACRTSDRTKDNSLSNSPNISRIETKPRAGARACSKHKRGKKHAVLFTVGCVLDAASHLHRADRRSARARARCEVAAIGTGIEFLNPSGIDWRYWEKRWEEMSIPTRELTAKREIIPKLLNYSDVSTEAIREVAAPREIAESQPTAEQIRLVREQLEKKISPTKGPEVTYPDIDCSNPEMKILFEARARCSQRRING